MLEKIKELLGEELAGQVEAALKGKGKDGRDIELVIGNDGSYVPTEKVETERQARTSAETALKNAAAASREWAAAVIRQRSPTMWQRPSRRSPPWRRTTRPS